MSRKYPIRYSIELAKKGEEWTKENAGESNGMCDAIIVTSIIHPADGSLSMKIYGIDGRTKEMLADDEFFKYWALLAKNLAESKTLGPNKRALAEGVHEAVKTAVLRARDDARTKN